MENILLIVFIALITGTISLLLSKFHAAKKTQILQTEKAVLETELTIVKASLTETKGIAERETERAEQYNTGLSEKAAQKDAAEKQVEKLTSDLNEEQLKAQQQSNDIQKLEKEKASLQTELKFANEKLGTQKEEIEDIGKKFEKEFSNGPGLMAVCIQQKSSPYKPF